MYKRLINISLTLLTLSSCSLFDNRPVELDFNEIRAIMAAQEQAWNRGDLEGFMNGYLESDSLLFIGESGLRLGWETTLKGYQKSYSSPDEMGRLEFENLKFKSLSRDAILVIGKWTLFRVEDTLSGHYSLNWQRKADGWKIISDHSS